MSIQLELLNVFAEIKTDDNMKSARPYVRVNGVPTNILTWGRWIQESLDDVKEIIICITGNPGLPGFYTKFASAIHKNLGDDIPIWVIGHAGHDDQNIGDELSEDMKRFFRAPTLRDNEHLYNLSGQVKHKFDFIEKYVPKNVKINLVGHSIGAWMVLELLKHDSIKTRIKKSYLLFPTIERMADSKNGKVFEFYRFFAPICIYLLHFISYLPVIAKILIIRIYFWFQNIPKQFVGTAISYSNPASMEKVIFLAKDEMKNVRELDQKHIIANKHILRLYYGRTDGWVPVNYFEEIKAKIPDLDAQLCMKGIAHSFVLQHSEIMGEIISDWIRQDV